MKKVVIIGGGFAGSKIARALEREFDVTLIDNKDYFEFTPGIIRTIIEPEHIKKLQVLHKDYLRRTKLVLGEAKDVTDKYVKVKDNKISYDYLVIASGSRYNIPFKESNVVSVARADHLFKHHKAVSKAKSIAIIGGGMVGTELAGELCKMQNDKEITIIHSANRLIERNPERASVYAHNFLTSRDVKIIYGEMAVKNSKLEVKTDKGNRIKADMVFVCTGIIQNYEFLKNNFPKSLNERKQVKVNGFLQVEGFRNVFAAGDINNISMEKTAQNAKNQAKIVINNIKAMENNTKLKEFSPAQTPLIISLGKYHGIFVSGKFVLTGLIPSLMKYFVEKKEMLRY